MLKRLEFGNFQISGFGFRNWQQAYSSSKRLEISRNKFDPKILGA